MTKLKLKKALLTTLLITTSLSVNAEWEEISMGMYEVMKLDGAEIISETIGGANNNRLITTMRIGASKMVGFDYYRCSNHTTNMAKHDCWKLIPDK